MAQLTFIAVVIPYPPSAGCVVSLFVFPSEWCSALWCLARLSDIDFHVKNPWAQQNHQQVVAFWDGFKSKQKSFHWSQKSCWIHQFPRCLMIRSRWKLSIWARFVLLLKILYSRQKLIEVESMTYVFSNCFLRIRNSVKSEWPS